MALAPQPTSQLQSGDVVAERYAVLRLLGQGGMGEVYEAIDSKLDRRVALKIVLATASADARRRLESEAKAVAALEHPGIVTLHDVLDHGGRLVLVLELVQGESLRDVLDTGPLSPPTVARLVAGVADALEAAHKLGFVHRDVKPDNIVMRPDGRTVLLDFGIAKGPQSASPMAVTVTAAGALVGTPAYLAPEQIREEPVSAATDQFALAVTAYELATGVLPWKSASVSAIMASIVADPPRSFREPPSPDDAKIDAVFARALHKKPEERYPSISAFAAALADVLGGEAQKPREALDTDPSERKARTELRTLTAPIEAGERPKPSSRGAFAWVALAATALAGGALWVATSGTDTPAATPPLPSSGAVESARAAALPDELPASGAQSEEDRTAYRAAIRALRWGDLEGAIRQLDAAIKRSPGFAGAQLMRSYASFIRAFDLDEPGRVAFRAASAERDRLSERDAKLLDALAPSFLDPPRWRESGELMQTFVHERPLDVLGWEVLGFARTKLGDYPAAELAFSEELAIDPQAALAYNLKAQFAMVRRDNDSAKTLLETCTREVPAAMRCRVDISLLSAATGQCAAADSQARDILAIDPASPRALAVRAHATATLGAPNDVVAGFLEKRRQLMPKGLLHATEIEDAFVLAKRSGDLTAALATIESRSKDPELDSGVVGRLTMVQIETLWETGQRPEAAKLARDYLRLEATRPLPERGSSDITGRLLMVLFEAGAITAQEHASRRDEWIAAWRSRRTETEWRNEVGFDLWLSAYAAVAIPTAQQANAALDAAKKLQVDVEPRGSVNVSPTDVDASTLVGAMLASADRLDEAEKLLRAATQRCVLAPDQLARLALGNLLARRGDNAGACATYAAIEKDWANVKPRSVTVEAAREATKKLGCANKP